MLILVIMKHYLKIWKFRYCVIKINYELTCQRVTGSKKILYKDLHVK